MNMCNRSPMQICSRQRVCSVAQPRSRVPHLERRPISQVLQRQGLTMFDRERISKLERVRRSQQRDSISLGSETEAHFSATSSDRPCRKMGTCWDGSQQRLELFQIHRLSQMMI